MVTKNNPQRWMFVKAKNEKKEYQCESQTYGKEYIHANLINER